MTALLERAWRSILEDRRHRVVAGVILFNLALTLFTAGVTLRGFPNSADEYALLLSAELFADGRLYVESPPAREFFDLYHVINNGRFYGKYPPGWPAILSGAARAGAPILMNPLLGALAVVLIYMLAREAFSVGVGNAAAFLCAANPFLIFNAASYFAHPAALVFVGGGLLACLRILRRPDALWAYAAAGAGFGAAFLIRPYTAAATLFPAGICVLLNGARHGRLPGLLRRLPLVLGPAAAGVGLFLLYNRYTTGDFFVQPFTLYDPNDHPGLTPTGRGPVWGLLHNVVFRSADLGLWVPLSPFFLAASLVRPGAAGALLLSSFAGLALAHGAYLFGPGNEYGPRYWFEALPCVIALSADTISRRGSSAAAWGAFLLAANLAVWIGASIHHGREVRQRTLPYELVRRAGVNDAIVFLRTGAGSMPPRDLIRNGFRFDGSVLYALDFGPRNEVLRRAFPRSTAFVFEYDVAARAGRLTRWESPGHPPGMERKGR